MATKGFKTHDSVKILKGLISENLSETSTNENSDSSTTPTYNNDNHNNYVCNFDTFPNNCLLATKNLVKISSFISETGNAYNNNIETRFLTTPQSYSTDETLYKFTAASFNFIRANEIKVNKSSNINPYNFNILLGSCFEIDASCSNTIIGSGSIVGEKNIILTTAEYSDSNRNFIRGNNNIGLNSSLLALYSGSTNTISLRTSALDALNIVNSILLLNANGPSRIENITNTFYTDYPNYYFGNMPTTANTNPGYLYKDENGFIKIS